MIYDTEKNKKKDSSTKHNDEEKKYFSDIEHDYENAWIKLKQNGEFMIYPIYDDLEGAEEEGLDTLGDLLNGLYNDKKELQDRIDQLEDDNMKYSLGIAKSTFGNPRFQQTLADFEIHDTHTNRFYWLEIKENTEAIIQLLNQFDKEINDLITCVKNQGVIINDLMHELWMHDKDKKIPIVLTRKDLYTLDKAISYYTHDKIPEYKEED